MRPVVAPQPAMMDRQCSSQRSATMRRKLALTPPGSSYGKAQHAKKKRELYVLAHRSLSNSLLTGSQ